MFQSYVFCKYYPINTKPRKVNSLSLINSLMLAEGEVATATSLGISENIAEKSVSLIRRVPSVEGQRLLRRVASTYKKKHIKIYVKNAPNSLFLIFRLKNVRNN